MWARYGDPDGSDTTVGIRLELSSSDELQQQQQQQQQSSGGAGGDTDSESPLMVAPLRRLHYRHQRPANPDDSVSAILDRASVLLSQRPPMFGLVDSSEPEETPGRTPSGRGDREFYRIRAAVCHGHMQAGGGSGRSLPPQPPQPPPPPSLPPPPPAPQLQRQPPTAGWETPHDARSTATNRTRYFFESTFLNNLPVAAAKEASESSPTEICTPMQPPPAADSATVGTAERPLCAVFRCCGPDQPLRPPPVVQRRTPCARQERRESRTAACQTDTVDFQRDGSASTQTDDTGTAVVDFGSVEPLPQPPPPPQKPPEPRVEAPSAGSTRPSRQSASRPEFRSAERPATEQRARQPLRFRGDELTSEDESEEQREENLQRRLEPQQQELHRQQLIESRLSHSQTVGEAGVLRVVGRRLNAFFCSGRSCCGASSSQAAAGAATNAVAATDASAPSAARISEESQTSWPPRATNGAGLGRSDVVEMALRESRQPETAGTRIVESPSANDSRAGASSDDEFSESDFVKWTPIGPAPDRQQRERRRSSDTNMNSRQSSQPASRRSRRPSPTSDKRNSPKSVAADVAPADTKEKGNGLDCLLQTLDRAARRRQWERQQRTLAEASAASSRTASPASQQPIKRLSRWQPQRPRVERCRFQICEVTCELGSFGLAGTDADEEDELLTENEDKTKMLIRADGNQSNAFSRSSRRSKHRGKVSSTPASSSNRRHQQEAVIGSVAESLEALSRKLEQCVNTIKDTVTELQR